MAIPRFNAQIGGIQIPSMKNYQEEENATIANALSKFGSDILGASIKAYSDQQKKTKKQLDDLYEAREYLLRNKKEDKEGLSVIENKIKDLGGKV